MKKHNFVGALIVIMMLALTFAFVGCDKGDLTNPEYTPGDAFAEVARRMIDSDKIKLGQQMSVDIICDVTLKNHHTNKAVLLEFFMRGNANYNADATNADNNFVFEIVNKSNDSKIIGLYADGEYLYVDLAEEHYRVENFRLKDMLMGKSDDEKSARVVDIESVFKIVGDLLFESVQVVDNNEFTFNYNLAATVDKYDYILIELVGLDNVNKFASTLGYDDWNHFVIDVMGELKGELVYSFDRNNNLDRQQLNNHGDKNSFNISMPQFSITDGNYMIDYDKYIDKNVEWITTKLMNMKLCGSLNIVTGDTAVGVYEWELITNLDPLELMANKGDFNLDTDDMAHFILRARPDKSTKEYNDSRVKATGGVVLEIAYSPAEFKNNNLMITMNPKAIMSKTMVKELGIPEVAMGFLPEYYGAHIDVDMLREIGSIGKIEQKSGVKSGLNIIDILSGITVNSDGLTLDVSIFGGVDSQIGKIIGTLLSIGDSTADKVNIKVDYSKFGDRTNGGYKVKDHFLYIADPQNNEFKDFGGSLGFNPAAESQPIVNDGYVEMTTNSGKVLNLKDGNTRISPEELGTLIGGKVKYNYTDFWGKTHVSATPLTIIGLSNVDLSNTSEPQTVNIITSISDGKNMLSLLSSMGIIPNIPGNVYATKILLTAEKSSNIIYFKELNYRVGDELVDSELGAELSIEYASGDSYKYNSKIVAHDIELTKIGAKQAISRPGEYTISYDIGGRTIIRNVTVAPAKKVEMLLDSVVIGKKGDAIDKSYGKVKIYEDDEKYQKYDIVSDMIQFPKGAVEDNMFKVAGEYYIDVNAFGQRLRMLVTVEPISLVLPTTL